MVDWGGGECEVLYGDVLLSVRERSVKPGEAGASYADRVLQACEEDRMLD